jgi:hypothetical protein
MDDASHPCCTGCCHDHPWDLASACDEGHLFCASCASRAVCVCSLPLRRIARWQVDILCQLAAERGIPFLCPAALQGCAYVASGRGAEADMQRHRAEQHPECAAATVREALPESEPEPERGPAAQWDVCPVHPCGEAVAHGSMLEHITQRHPYVINPAYLYWGTHYESRIIFMENGRVIGTLTTERLPRKSREDDRFMRAQWSSKLDTRLRIYGGGRAGEETTTLEPNVETRALLCFGSYQRRAGLVVVYP